MNNNDDKRQPRTTDGATSLPESNARLIQQWIRVAERLIPLVGESGFCAMYIRAVRLAQPGYAWLSSDLACRSVAPLLELLSDDLAAVDSALAACANDALFTTFTKLLSGMIGEALTMRLLHSATSDESGQTNAQEQKHER